MSDRVMLWVSVFLSFAASAVFLWALVWLVAAEHISLPLLFTGTLLLWAFWLIDEEMERRAGSGHER